MHVLMKFDTNFLTDIMELKCSFVWLAIKLMLHSTQINEVRLEKKDNNR